MDVNDAKATKRAHGLETQRALLAAAGAVFSRMAYADARLKDIAEEAGISQGSLYFHFGNKDDVARAVLSVQQERMGQVLTTVQELAGSALDCILGLFEGLADLIATDELVQAGIRLSMQPATGLEVDSSAPYVEWVEVAASILRGGVADGSMAPDLDVRAAAELLNEIFVGAQVLSGLEDKWASLPRRVASARAGIRTVLTSSTRAA
ncbi:TetR/AcrR family transcriptional regulator [Microbacterium capsulatum]|uniref:TetR/AcrR family transcriptional regulator n=1 Tax=Microbacterium capsulatum TaxID=3041921 RepID=A0ABU0XJ45_9MICO|nr:TetR/AcrR family transcriptional regulator [Microbacterium sp. ASV81]MDQ4213695.1 TetR/AcrR family transcriptional regulator [Microbacterium sp. ASV81]